MAEQCSASTQLLENLPDDLISVDTYEWQEMDVNEFHNDTMESSVLDANQNVLSQTIANDMNQNILSPMIVNDTKQNASIQTYESFDYSYYDHGVNTDCMPEMASSPNETLFYNYPNTCAVEFCQANFHERQYCNGYSSQNSLGETNSSPDSSLNYSYKADYNSNHLTLLQSQSWSHEEQLSDDSVELELTSFEDISRQEAKIPMSAYSSKHNHADALPHFAKVFPPKHQKSSKRGRPVTYLRRNNSAYNNYYSGDSSDEDDRFSTRLSPTKCKRGAKNVLLWKFLLEELRKPSGNLLQWVDEREGLFRFVDTTEVSKLWGQKKNKDDMNFEKLSRGIRHYYKEGLMARQEGTRLIYRFNWECVPTEYRRF